MCWLWWWGKPLPLPTLWSNLWQRGWKTPSLFLHIHLLRDQQHRKPTSKMAMVTECCGGLMLAHESCQRRAGTWCRCEQRSNNICLRWANKARFWESSYPTFDRSHDHHILQSVLAPQSSRFQGHQDNVGGYHQTIFGITNLPRQCTWQHISWSLFYLLKWQTLENFDIPKTALNHKTMVFHLLLLLVTMRSSLWQTLADRQSFVSFLLVPSVL